MTTKIKSTKIKSTKVKSTKMESEKKTKEAQSIKKVTSKVSPKVKPKELTEPTLGKVIGKMNLPMTGGKNFNFKEYLGKRVVLFFYPKDMTPGCTIEGHEFTQLVAEFKKLNTVVLGISRDTVDKHEKFIAKENYKIELVSDADETACEWFDVIKEKNMYGKKVMGIERSTFIIGTDGKVEHAWRKVKAEGHAAEVLAFVKAIKN